MIRETANEKHCEEEINKIQYPINLEDFLKANIPPVQYIIKPVLPEKGRMMISAPTGMCKTFLGLNLTICIGSGLSPYLEKFEITKRPVLYVCGEGEIGELRRRLDKIALIENLDKQNIYLAYIGLNLCDGKKYIESVQLESLLVESKAKVLIIDPISQFWSGNENEKQEVRTLTKLFDSLIEKHQISVIIIHHWKKPGKDSKADGYMASGSHWWVDWVDGHITLHKKNNKLVLSLAKIRSNSENEEFPPLTITLREDNLWLECIAIGNEKIDKHQIDEIFDSFGTPKIKLNDLAKEVKKKGLCTRNTLEKYIKQYPDYEIDDTDKTCFYVVKKGK